MGKVQELENLIQYHREKYYNDQPVISDAAFDELVDELKSVAPESKILVTVGSRVKVSGWKKKSHFLRMGSLNKILLSEIDNIFEKTRGSKLVVMEKFDGISIELIYIDGILKHAVTRGDGNEGEDILENVLLMRGVKKEIKDFTGGIRAEIILSKENFDKLNKGVNHTFSNPRNAASGIARCYDGQLCDLLELKYYNVSASRGNFFFPSYMSKLRFLINYVKPEEDEDYAVVENRSELLELYDYYIRERENLPYNIDGLVLTIDDEDAQLKFGYVNNTPKFSWALKFPAAAKKTTLLDIEWNVTRTGRVNPKAVIAPIDIEGSTIKYATLHNMDYIRNLNLGIGDEVMVKKMGDIIPAVVEVVVHKNNPAQAPKQCPSCGMFLETESVFLLCKNKECPAQNITKLIHYCSVIGMDRVGSGIIEKIVEYANLYKIEELYKLTKEQLLAIPGVGETVANNFLDQLHEKSFMTFHTFLVALGLDGLADKNAQIMCNKIVNDGSDDIESALGFLKSDWRWKQEFTEQTAEKIKNSISVNYENIQKLVRYIRFNWENEKTSEKLTGKSFCITGSLEYAKRDDYIKMIKDNGGEYKSSVGKGLTYLVTNDTESGSSKNKRAKELGIEIIDENQLRSMLI